MLNNLILSAALRGVTIAASSFLTSKGWMTGDEFQTVTAGLVTIGTIAYSVFKRTTNQQIKDTAKLPAVSQVVKRTGEVVR